MAGRRPRSARAPWTSKDKLPPDIQEAVDATDGLPFARRTLLRHLRDAKRVEDALSLLKRAKLLRSYPPLCERKGVRVAQTEHTIFISETGAEVLTMLRDAPATAPAAPSASRAST